MQGTPKDNMFGDFSRRAQARYEPPLQLLLGERRDCTLEGFLVKSRKFLEIDFEILRSE